MDQRIRLTILVLAVAALSASWPPAYAAPATQPTGDSRSFMLTPAALPVPALKYRFDFPLDQQLDGNAALSYFQATTMFPPPSADDKTGEARFGSVTAADVELESDEEFESTIEEKLPWFDTGMPYFMLDASKRTNTDWEIPLRENGSSGLLPHLNRQHDLNLYVIAKARLALIRGETDQAINLARAGILQADRIDGGDVATVNHAASIGLQGRMMGAVARIMQHPASPNLYWALRSIPSPTRNLARAIDGSNALTFIDVPELGGTRQGELTEDVWTKAVSGLRSKLANVAAQMHGNDEERRDLATRASDLQQIAANEQAILPSATAHYAATRKISLKDAAAIGNAKLVDVFYFEMWQANAEQFLAAASLPYSQMLPLMKAANDDYNRLKKQQASNPFFAYDLSPYRVVIKNAQLDQTIAALAAIEAIRAYAADHDGALPPSLDAITQAPPPENPLTGKPFSYKVIGDQAVLSDDVPLVVCPLKYEIQMRK